MDENLLKKIKAPSLLISAQIVAGLGLDYKLDYINNIKNNDIDNRRYISPKTKPTDIQKRIEEVVTNGVGYGKEGYDKDQYEFEMRLINMGVIERGYEELKLHLGKKEMAREKKETGKVSPELRDAYAKQEKICLMESFRKSYKPLLETIDEAYSRGRDMMIVPPIAKRDSLKYLNSKLREEIDKINSKKPSAGA